jgi:hypothetical protein
MTNTKRVSFSNNTTIAYTHSSIDYDRSPFSDIDASNQILQFRNNLLMQPQPIIYPQQQQQQKQQKRPIALLKINMSCLNSTGPLFFTNLSTNYHKFLPS